MVGYFLLLVGIFVIVTCVFNIYGVFRRTIEPSNYFDLEAIVVNNEIPINNLPENIKSILGASLKQSSTMVILSKKDINEIANFCAHLFIMGFIMNSGYLFAKIGIKIAREVNINVEVLQNKTNQTP